MSCVLSNANKQVKWLSYLMVEKKPKNTPKMNVELVRKNGHYMDVKLVDKLCNLKLDQLYILGQLYIFTSSFIWQIIRPLIMSEKMGFLA